MSTLADVQAVHHTDKHDRFKFRQTQKKVLEEVGRKEYDDFNSDLRKRFSTDGLGAKRGKGFLGWVYGSDIGKTWKEFVEKDQAQHQEDVKGETGAITIAETEIAASA